jgi:hypothetical protein
MNELLMKRIQRRLESLPDDQGYQVLDYVEFLEIKYGVGDRKPSVIERISDGVEDTLRAGKVSASAIKGTMGAVGTATKVMDRLAQAGKAAVDELGKALGGEAEEAEEAGEVEDLEFKARRAEPPVEAEVEPESDEETSPDEATQGEDTSKETPDSA